MDDTEQADIQVGEPLFAGDTGTLTRSARFALCKLLAGPFVDAESAHWPTVALHEAQLRSRLADLLLELVIDRDRRIAFVRQVPVDGGPVLLRNKPMTFLESVLVLHLREVLLEAEARGERAAVDEGALIEHLEVYLPNGGDRVKVHDKIRVAIGSMKGVVLRQVRGADGRYEISPILRLLFTADDVDAMRRTYEGLAGVGGTDAESDGDDDA